MSLETKDLLNTKLGHMGPKHKPFLVLDISWEEKIHLEKGRILVTLKISDPFSSIFNWNFFFFTFFSWFPHFPCEHAPSSWESQRPFISTHPCVLRVFGQCRCGGFGRGQSRSRGRSEALGEVSAAPCSPGVMEIALISTLPAPCLLGGREPGSHSVSTGTFHL